MVAAARECCGALQWSCLPVWLLIDVGGKQVLLCGHQWACFGDAQKKMIWKSDLFPNCSKAKREALRAWAWRGGV